MASRSRVLHVSPAHPANDPRIVYKQLPALAQYYDLICLLPGPYSAQHPESVRFVSLPRFRWLGWRLLIVHPLIFWYIIRFRPSVLHIYMPELLPVALLCQLIFRLKVIYEVQENLRLKFARKAYNNHWLFQQTFDWFDQLARRHCYFIFTDDSYLTTYSNLRFPSAIIHNYPDISFIRQFTATTPVVERAPEFLYLGLVTFDRGLDIMIKAIALLKPTYPTIRLHLFGRCLFDWHEVEARPEFRQVRENLIFYGQTDLALALPIAAHCVAGLALLKPVGDYPASYPTKLFEYMALGLPVIASHFPLYRSIIEQHRCGFCVDPDKPEAVTECLQSLLSNASNRNLMGLQAYQVVTDKYSWEKEKLALLNFYKILT